MKYRGHTTNSSFLAKRLAKKSRRRFLITVFITGILFYSLFTWLLPNLIGGLSVINKFKNNSQTQTSPTDDSGLTPPVLNIPYEATNSASISIKGYTLSNTKVEVYLDDELKSTTNAQEDGSFLTDPIQLNIGTNNIYGKTVDSKGGKSLSSKTIKVIYINEKPKLELLSPQDNHEIKGGDKKITISGLTDTNKNITVSANNIRLIVSSDGNFSQSIDITEGENSIVVTATDEAGNITQITRKVTYTP